MASLKEINSSVQEGNEDLQKLNENFASWLNMQKTSGDDLEAAKEARQEKKKPRGGMSNVFQKQLLGKKGGLFGTGMGLKTLIGLTALIAPIIFDLFKDEIAKYLRNLLGGEGKSLRQLVEDYLKKVLDRPVTNLPTKIKFPKFFDMKVKPQPTVTVPKTISSPKLKPGIVTGRSPGAMGGRTIASGTVNPKAPTASKPYTNPAKGIYNNAYKDPKNGSKFSKVPKSMVLNEAARAQSTGRAPISGGGFAKPQMSSKKSALVKILNKFNPANGNRGSTGHWFTAVVDAIGKYVPGWIKTFLKRVVGFMLNRGMKYLFGFEIILILCDLRFDLATMSIVEYKYGPVEKAVKIVALPIAVYISFLGGFIGGIVGTAFLGPVFGTAIGAVVGGIVFYTAAYKIIMILLEFYEGGDYSAKAFAKLLEKHLAPLESERLTSELRAERNRKMGKAKQKNSNSQTAFSKVAMGMRGVDMMVSSGNMSAADGFMRKNDYLTGVESQFYDAVGNTTPFLKEERQKLLGQIPGPLLGPLLGNAKASALQPRSELYGMGSQFFRGANPLTDLDKENFSSGLTSGGISTSFLDQSQRTDTKLTMAIGGGEDFHTRNSDQNLPWMPMPNFRSVG